MEWMGFAGDFVSFGCVLKWGMRNACMIELRAIKKRG
jgi:hypothetical protein